MKIKSIYCFFIFLFCFFIFSSSYIFGQGIPKWLTIPETDSSAPQSPESLTLFYVFDLRERETFIQFTYQGPLETGNDDDDFSGLFARTHVQIFDVSNNCNENNFFDVYTVNDTHVYNLRNIETNDGNPSGVVLSEGAYGIVAISYTGINGEVIPLGAFGNLRIEDNNGYEYRTNAQQLFRTIPFQFDESEPNPAYTFNFNIDKGVILSDVIGVTINSPFNLQETDDDDAGFFFEWNAADVLSAFNPFDVDLLDNNETIFSCRDITFSCVNQEHPLLEQLLSESGTSVASFEYGINNAIPHSKAGELLCPGNNISEGFVVLNPEGTVRFEDIEFQPHFFGFIGLNNGNGRGSMDSLWNRNICELFGFCDGPT